MKYSNYIGAFSSILLIISCYFPWVYIQNIQTTITGFHAPHTNFGQPGLMHVILATITIPLFLLKNLVVKRFNVFVCAFNFSWSMRNFFLITHCELGECPEKQYGIFLIVFFSFSMLLMSLLPKGEMK